MEKNIIAIKGIKKTNLFTNLDAILFALMISKLVIKEKPENGVKTSSNVQDKSH